jgi:opacity protein-like surface antigen
MGKLSTFLAVIGVACGVAATEAAADGAYVGLRGGASILSDSDMTIELGGGGSIPATLLYEPGWTGSLAGGYAWDNGFAVEGEFTFRQNGLDGEELMGALIPVGGHLRSYALMANGYYRVNTGSIVTPYVGAGVGGALLTVDAESVGGDFNDDSVEFAYQAMAGLMVEITPQLDAGLEYRFFGTTTPSFSDTVVGGGAVTVDPDYFAHNILLTLTYSFP